MKKLFLIALAFCSLTAFAQTNLFDASQASVLSTWGAEDVNPTATWNATTGELSITLNTAQPGWQWGNQVAFGHNVDFEAGKYYQVSMTLLADAACGGVTIKIDDAGGMIFENQSVNLVANTPLNYVSAASAGVVGNHKMVFDFGYGVQGTQITISNIVIVETEAPAFNGCEGEFVASSGNAALGHDGNTGTRWESASADPQYWQWNMAEAQTFNRIKIVWEGAYAKDFNILAGTTCDNMVNILTVTNQQGLAGATLTQIYELSESVTASHIQFEGVTRATGYGYSFWEFDVYTAQTSVLTSLDFTAAATICKVGENVNLTATPKDQYGVAMADQTVSYAVSPASAGHVNAGVYTADAAGLATITATCGTLTKTVEIFNYAGDNVALNKTVTGNGFNDAARVNDGNEGTEYQADPNNGGAGQDVDAEFVIDLGAAYDLELVTIKFEGACSDAYTLETSADNTVFEVAHSYSGTNGINGHTDYLFGENLANATGVRYIKFHSTKNATGWGMKIFELKAFGVEHITTAIDNLETVKAVKVIENGRIVIIKNGVRYNAQGARL